MNFVNRVVAANVKKVLAHRFAEVAYFDGDRTFLKHFRWAILRDKFAAAFAQYSIPFTVVEPWDVQDCRRADDSYDCAKIYEKLRAQKAVRTKNDKKSSEIAQFELAVKDETQAKAQSKAPELSCEQAV
jgi:hypothetical protein